MPKTKDVEIIKMALGELNPNPANTRNISNGDMWLELLEDNELMTETCMTPDMFRPILTPKERVMEYILGIEGSFTWSKTEMLDELCSRNMITLPGESS